MLAALVRQRFAEPVHLFGNSMGGAISVQLAGRYPQLIRSLTLVSPAARLDPDAHEHSAAGHRGAGHRPPTGHRIAQLPVEQRVQATMNLVRKPPWSPPRGLPKPRRTRFTAQNPWSGQAFQSALRGILAT